ncbi:hypothetical protein CLPU_4c01250 [Gottschalkia purinilytica]|uniref:Uncharacterized protein n=1 Tax=Gottschalkia purinilytica TaxID=1503 RepID=A0A0L0WC77_GOTPU|nr:hypothetical protein CLPU_4c01250 [Gottschalkia purinilytica]
MKNDLNKFLNTLFIILCLILCSIYIYLKLFTNIRTKELSMYIIMFFTSGNIFLSIFKTWHENKNRLNFVLFSCEILVVLSPTLLITSYFYNILVSEII